MTISPRVAATESVVRCGQARWFERSDGERLSVSSEFSRIPEYLAFGGAFLRDKHGALHRFDDGLVVDATEAVAS